MEIATTDDRFECCEGWALSDDGFAFMHAWVAPGRAAAVEVTLPHLLSRT